MTAVFQADPAFEAGSVVVCDWPLCQLRLQDDARYPWLILIPRRAGLHEIEDLTPAERAALMDEVVRAGDMVRSLGRGAGRPVQKLNVAALGNVTAQLHVHVIGRRADDPAWPRPVWNEGQARPYGEELALAVGAVRSAVGVLADA